jgi:hypothetical protein
MIKMFRTIVAFLFFGVLLTSCGTPAFLTIENNHIYANMKQWDYVTYFENTKIKLQNEFNDQNETLQAKFEVIDTVNNIRMSVDLNSSPRMNEQNCMERRLPSLGFSPMEQKKLVIKEKGTMKYFDRFIEYDGKKKVDLKVYYAFIYENDYCIMARISKKGYKESDKAMLEKILMSIAIKEVK